MFAPAQKNFSPAPVMQDDVHIASSNRALRDARRRGRQHHLVGVGVGRRVVQDQVGDARL